MGFLDALKFCKNSFPKIFSKDFSMFVPIGIGIFLEKKFLENFNVFKNLTSKSYNQVWNGNYLATVYRQGLRCGHQTGFPI